MLQGDALRVEKCRGNLSKAGEPYIHLQIRLNVKVYVNDMLVKSLDEDKHLDDLQETFDMLK